MFIIILAQRRISTDCTKYMHILVKWEEDIYNISEPDGAEIRRKEHMHLKNTLQVKLHHLPQLRSSLIVNK